MPFVAGPIPVDSSWARSVGFWEQNDKTRGIKAWMGLANTQGICIVFKDGSRCFYPGTTKAQYRSLLSARSKGKWIHKHLYGEKYELV